MKAIHNTELKQTWIFFVVLYLKDTEKWKQFTTQLHILTTTKKLCCIPKILKNESNSQHGDCGREKFECCVVSQRYWKMKAIHNRNEFTPAGQAVVLYPKDTEKWKQFTTEDGIFFKDKSCVVSQRYWKMKAIHNIKLKVFSAIPVVLYPKDTEKWKQFTTGKGMGRIEWVLCCIPKILKNESNSQLTTSSINPAESCVVSQRYWKMKAIHNNPQTGQKVAEVVLYPKDTEKWKQFTTIFFIMQNHSKLCCIPKILKNESNSQLAICWSDNPRCCVVSQRYWKMKAIHNRFAGKQNRNSVVLYPKDTEKWKQFTTYDDSDYADTGLCCIPKILKNESNSQLQLHY